MKPQIKLYIIILQIDRASAANVKRSKDEIAADTEAEDDFGYTMSEYIFKLPIICSSRRERNFVAIYTYVYTND